jgi:acetyltransferase-like isoleucine patch superfamily enzyme
MSAPIISPQCRIRHPELFHVGEGSIIDDFSYFSTQVRVGRYSHIASGCSIAGGRERLFTLGDYSSLSSGVKVWCASDDFVRDLVTIIPSGAPPIKENFIIGDVTLGPMTAIGANSVIMPQNTLPEGVAVGALSFVPPNFPFEAWTVYAGTPIRRLKARDRDSVLRQRDALEAYLRRLAT